MWAPLAGGIAGAFALPLLVVLPEAGLPLAFVALRLLATRFAWATRVDGALRHGVGRVRGWFRKQPRLARFMVSAGLLATLGAGLWLTFAATLRGER